MDEGELWTRVPPLGRDPRLFGLGTRLETDLKANHLQVSALRRGPLSSDEHPAANFSDDLLDSAPTLDARQREPRT